MTASFLKVDDIIDNVRHQIESDNFAGYDPYDTLNSPFLKPIGKWGKVIATQFQKRNPINIRPLLLIKKEINPKAIGLFLQAYSKLYRLSPSKELKSKCETLFSILDASQNKSSTGTSWGYNFEWVSPKKTLPKHYSNVVATSFVVQGLKEYFEVFGELRATELIAEASNYVTKDLHVSKTEIGKCISYSKIDSDFCYNASLLASEILATDYFVNKNKQTKELIKDTVSYVISRQHSNGSWMYSYDPVKKAERRQIDFHQGYILNSLKNISELIDYTSDKLEKSLKNGLTFYKKYQFNEAGQSHWRLPKKWPTDIHNQAQGIITFTLFSDSEQAQNIYLWTIKHMYDNQGKFYYKKYPIYSIKTTFTRWSQAWMLLALINLKLAE